MSIKLGKYVEEFKSGKYILFLNIFERLFYFFLFLIIARNYSTQEYGELITIFTLSNVLTVIFNLGFSNLLQRQSAISREKISFLFSNIFIIQLFGLLIYLVSCFILKAFFYSEVSFYLFLFIVLYNFLTTFQGLFNSVLSGLSKYKIQFILTFYSQLMISGIVIFILNAKLGNLILYLFITNFVFLYIYYHTGLKDNNVIFLPSSTKLRDASNILKMSIPLWLAVIFNFLYDKVDILLISYYLGFSQAAFYNVGYGIYKSSAIAFTFILVTGYTKAAFLSKRKIAIILFINKYLKLLLMIGIVIFIIFFFLTELIINTIYSAKYFDLILKIMSFAVIGLALNNFTGVVLNGLGKFKENMMVTFFGFIINIFLNILFIPKFGIIAAALISVITEYIILTGDLFFIYKYKVS